ncbi:MAG: VWA domain containing CoxE-like protein [Promethearchaeota archaeon]|nr:MAG: VWA domain containing CoxE-like protein [Candidatus Lokiarchaeota archaeon]
MGVFPENPCEFAVEFIRRMRNHPDIVQIPSSRQVLSIPRLILSRYYRKGKVTPNDYIEISRVTSFPDNQELANEIAFEVIFPNYKKNMVSEFFEADSDGEQFGDKDFLEDSQKSELEQIQDLVEEIEMSVDTDKIKELEDFIDQLNQNRNEEPYKSALRFFNDDTELYKEEISSLKELIKEAQHRLEQKINSLEPEDLKAASNLDLNDLIEQNSLRKWEKLTSQALNNKDISKELGQMMNSGNFDDLMQSLKYLQKTDALDRNKLDSLKDQLNKRIENLDQLFNAAKNLGETPQFDQEKVLNNSLQKSSFEHNFNLANSLDQYFNTDLRSSLMEKFEEKMSDPKTQSNLSLESLTKNAIASKSWNNLFNKALQNAVKNTENQKQQFEGFKSLSHQLQQLMNSCQNVHCSQKISQKIPEIVRKAIDSAKDSNQLRDTVEFLRKIGLKPEPEDIKRKGKELNMDEDEIYELIEPNYQLLKNLVEKNKADFERLQGLIERLKDSLNKERIKDLISSALSSGNRDALGALGHFDLNQALHGAQSVEGEEGMNKVVASLSAGSGENLLKQWFIHRKDLPDNVKQKVKELAKKMLIDLGIYYSRARLGSATTGPIPINIVRPYTVGDDMANIDLEETIFNILEKGKKLSHVDYDDFFVYETAKGLRSACFELDISGSMTGDKLAQMAISVTMLIYGLKKDEIAACFFESDTHVLKELDQKVNLEDLADELLSVTARGGTRIQNALHWAKNQFKDHSNSREKLNILFTDAEVYDLEQAMKELRIFRSMGIDFILVCPETSFNLEEAEKMVKIAGGQLLTISEWADFPKLISDIINSRF